MGFYADFIFRPGIFSVLLVSLGLLLFWFLPPFDHPALEIRSNSPPDPESSVSLRPQILKRPLHSRSTNIVVFVHYISRDFFPNDLHEYRILRLVLLRILGDPGAVSWAGRKGVTKVFKHWRAEELFRPCLKTFVASFLLWRRFARKIGSKSTLKSAKSPLPVDMRPSKSTLLFKSSINNHCSKKMGNAVQRTIHRESSEAIGHHKYLGHGVELSSDLNC